MVLVPGAAQVGPAARLRSHPQVGQPIAHRTVLGAAPAGPLVRTGAAGAGSAGCAGSCASEILLGPTWHRVVYLTLTHKCFEGVHRCCLS